MSNPHEEANRLKKVLAIISVVPAGATRDEIAKTAAWLEQMTLDQRNRFAKDAGAKSDPSDETWRQVCEAARARRPADELFARAGASR